MSVLTDTTTVKPRRRRFHAVMAATVAVMALAACTGSDAGTITDNSSPTPSASATSGLVFAFEPLEDFCPTADVIPDELAAPDTIGYTADTRRREEPTYYSYECSYSINDSVTSLDGMQAVQSFSVNFIVSDGSPIVHYYSDDLFPVNFDEVDAAAYFREWDQAIDRYEDRGKSGYGLEESRYVSFEAFVSIDNLYVYTSMSLVMPEDYYPTTLELNTNETAYRILEAIVPPIVEGLERQ